MRWEIRPVRRDDAAAAAKAVRVIAVAYAGEAELLGIMQEDCPTHPAFAGERYLSAAAAMQNAHAYALYEGADMAGFLLLRELPDAKMEIMRLCVVPQSRGRGYGSQLLAYAQLRARALKSKVIVANVASENKDAARWYTRHGYEQKGTLRFPNVPYTIGFVEKEL